MKEARRKADQLALYLDETARVYTDIMTYFGEDAGDENARRDFFAKLAGFVSEWKKSHEKNVLLEEQKRKIEASMARKRTAANSAAAAALNGDSNNTSLSNGSGAMDSLLEKLKAAGPQGRDQRDRRRRARLKERHADRVASGQQMPELQIKDGLEDSRGLRGTSIEAIHEGEEAATNGEAKAEVSEAEDVADRAAVLLAGLRSKAPEEEDTISVGRRRANADQSTLR